MRQINGSKRMEVNNASFIHNDPWLAGSFELLSILTPKAKNTYGEFLNWVANYRSIFEFRHDYYQQVYRHHRHRKWRFKAKISRERTEQCVVNS
jgi:hypothetical protein